MQMDSFEAVNIKVEKANAIHKHRQLQKIANMFRFIEVCVVLVLISRLSTQLPVAVKNSGEHFRDLTVALTSPRFVFIVGNAIVITLFAKFGQFSAQDSTTKDSGTDFYDEYVEKSERSQSIRPYELECREKQSICEENIVSEGTCTSHETKNYQRSQSESLKGEHHEKSRLVLRRSETEKCRKSISGEKSANISYPEDNMSNEEFRLTVEAFIARQQKLRREEEYSMI